MKKSLVTFVLLFCVTGPGGLVRPGFAEDQQTYENLELFTDVLSLVRTSYVEDTDTTTLIRGALRGMLATLDPHSNFLTPELYQEMQADTHGEFGGLGIEVTIKDEALVVVAPIADTPADRAGIRAGDRIVEISGRPTRDMDMMEAVRLMRGPQGEAVTLTIQRPGSGEEQTLTIVRAIIQLQSVKSRLLGNDYGYVRITQFQERTGGDLQRHLDELAGQSANGLQGLVLDLRNNPGGLLEQAVEVADLFLEEGLIVYTEGRKNEAQMSFSASAENTQQPYPLVILINGGSASAAEIVAGALQDHRRGVIIGEQSFGKGSVQTIIPLGEGSALRLTTARYFTPQGRSIQARGITPDIPVPRLAPPTMAGNDQPVREKDLQNHFEQERVKPDEPDAGADDSAQTANLPEDYQLRRALELLKGYRILESSRPAA